MVDRFNTSVFNTTGGGILQEDPRSPGTIGGLRDTIYNFAPAGGGAGVMYEFSGPLDFTAAGAAITFDVNLDADDPSTTTSPQSGVTYSYTIDKAYLDSVYPSLNGIISTATQMRSVLLSLVSGPISVSSQTNYPNRFGLSSRETSARGSSFQLTNLQSNLPGNATGVIADMPAPDYGSRAFTYSIFDGPFEIKPSVEIGVPIDEDGVKKTLIVTRDDVMAALGSTDGKIANMTEFVSLMNYVFDKNGVGIIASDLNGMHVRYDLDESVHKDSGWKTTVGILGAYDNVGSSINFLDIDVTGSTSIDTYLTGVEQMIKRATTGASTIGSLRNRLDMANEFAERLMSDISSGIGRLVDADMEAESSRLAAFQTQQQLALQSLSIANTSPKAMLSLFQ